MMVLLEAGDDRDHRRSEDCDEQDRKNEKHQGEEYLHRNFHGFFFRSLASFHAHLLRLGAKHCTDGNTIYICLNDGPDKRPKVGHCGAFGQ